MDRVSAYLLASLCVEAVFLSRAMRLVFVNRHKIGASCCVAASSLWRTLKMPISSMCCKKSSKESQLIQEEIGLVHLHVSRQMLNFINCVMLTAVGSIQLNILQKGVLRTTWPQMWTLVGYCLFLSIFQVCPGLLKAKTLNLQFMLHSAFGLLYLSPTHVPVAGFQLFSLLILAFLRIPAVIFPTSLLSVVLINVAFLTLTFLRTFYEEGWGEGCVPEAVNVFRNELMAFMGCLGLAVVLRGIIWLKVELRLDRGNIAAQLSAASSLLRLTCDAVVELDHELRLKSHCPSLAAMLLRDHPGASLQGMRFTDFMQPTDAARAKELLSGRASISDSSEDGVGGPPRADISAHAFHTRLVDSCSSKVCTEVFQVKYTKMDGSLCHLLGLRDFTDIKSLAGGNAEDAQKEALDGAMDSGVEKGIDIVFSPRNSMSLSEFSTEEDAQDYFQVNFAQKMFLDVDMEGLLIHAASPSLVHLAGTALADIFPSPHTTQLLQRLRMEAELLQARGEALPRRVFTYEDMPASLHLGEKSKITGTMQVFLTRYSRVNVLMAFATPRERVEPKKRRNRSRQNFLTSL